MREPKIGDVYYTDLSGSSGSVQTGLRPCVIFQNNIGNKFSPNVVVIPLTTAIKKTNMPTHVCISAASSGLERDSMALCENPFPISKDNLKKYLATLPKEAMREIAKGSVLASSAISYLSISELVCLREKALSLV